MSGMNRLSERTDRMRGARASVVLGWMLVLLAMVSCCSLASAKSADAHHGAASLGTSWAFTPDISRSFAPGASRSFTPVSAARTVVADAPGDRGIGSSCHVASEHATPVVLPAPPAPAALPSAPVVIPVGSLTGATGIRGPSNDAVDDVDHLRLQVQRI
ncbi:hypothetical protein FHX80_115486 [Streptomyces brevispora]|uniref:Uncharacterized protein n=2 Tax=Streptomyces brevispora TaxID=887462 RepID=A0A561V5V5_9ACTN|nr:hypothetical protein FHX80_115486 [Streptomyces brevispora]